MIALLAIISLFVQEQNAKQPTTIDIIAFISYLFWTEEAHIQLYLVIRFV